MNISYNSLRVFFLLTIKSVFVMGKIQVGQTNPKTVEMGGFVTANLSGGKPEAKPEGKKKGKK